MVITIPTWLLWALGIVVGVPAVLVILVLAGFGYVALTACRGGFWR